MQPRMHWSRAVATSKATACNAGCNHSRCFKMSFVRFWPRAAIRAHPRLSD